VRWLGEGKLLLSDSFPGQERSKLCLAQKVPLGVVLCIPPFNYPCAPPARPPRALFPGACCGAPARALLPRVSNKQGCGGSDGGARRPACSMPESDAHCSAKGAGWGYPTPEAGGCARSVNLAISKVAPALMAGNTVVLKPPTQGAAAAAHMVQCFAKAGLPPGVVSYVTGKGSEIGDYLTTHPLVNCVSFTGGDTGIAICKKSGMVRPSLNSSTACAPAALCAPAPPMPRAPAPPPRSVSACPERLRPPAAARSVRMRRAHAPGGRCRCRWSWAARTRASCARTPTWRLRPPTSSRAASPTPASAAPRSSWCRPGPGRGSVWARKSTMHACPAGAAGACALVGQVGGTGLHAVQPAPPGPRRSLQRAHAEPRVWTAGSAKGRRAAGAGHGERGGRTGGQGEGGGGQTERRAARGAPRTSPPPHSSMHRSWRCLGVLCRESQLLCLVWQGAGVSKLRMR